ncbi:mediator of RNA polymerase II transcription subunit 5 [Pyricularia oryzae Y34]|uniref:Mediator of RNA polymerase II transcription subunit 5 n=2 Tax=Pyricularia oryzae TaxID=318829 RepID=A0AA97NV84_PYRO3|nr:mediator of RNA polymerase II transcription subunit 5 [Pyricularia oryzae Y34]
MAESQGVGEEPRTGEGTESLRNWQDFIERCLITRLDNETFERFAPIHHAKYPLSPRVLAELFLRPQKNNHDVLDPRIPQYMQILLAHHYIDALSILLAMYKYSTSHKQIQDVTGAGENDQSGEQQQQPLRWGNSYATEEHIFYRLTRSVSHGTGIHDSWDALRIARIMAKWMELFTATAGAFAADMVNQQMQTAEERDRVERERRKQLPRVDEMESARAGFVMLLLGVCESKPVLGALGKPYAKTARKELSDALGNFVPTIMQSAEQISQRLVQFRTETLAGFEPVDKAKAAANADMDDFLDSTMGLDSLVVPEIPISNTRAGLYIYLNSLLVGRPLMDDAAIFNYLHNRYQGDLQQTAVDLILVSFDVVANAASVRQSPKAAHVLRSYLTNKVPLLLASLAASGSGLYPFNAAACVEHATRQVSSATFPNMSDYISSRSGNTLTEGTREDFLFACCLHGLIPETQIEPILNETCYNSLPTEGRLVKEALVQECLADPERTVQLVKDIEKCNGNVGAICVALTETLCGQLARDPMYLDVLLLFNKLSAIVYPLCDLLDNWKHDEDQGEAQPFYEEFGSMLLLLLALVNRYNLTAADMGARSPDSFVAKLIGKGRLFRPLDELSPEENGHLDKWIHGLFDSDAGGLGDELMSSCPPQEFYLLIPTLFYNIVLAVSTGSLSEDSLRCGVESLRAYQRRDPRNQEIEPLLRILKEHVPLSRRTGAAENSELEAWSSTPNGGLSQAVRSTIRGFIAWGLQPAGTESTPTAYTHRQLLAATRILGAKQTVRLILDELKEQVQAGNQSVAYDVCCAIICAPNVATDDVDPSSQVNLLDATAQAHGPQQRPMSLRQALRAAAEDWKRIHKDDPVAFEIVVRLHRRVEAQLAVSVSAAAAAAAEAVLQGDGGNMLDDAMAAAGVVDGDAAAAMALDAATVGLDMGGGGAGDLGLGGSTANSVGGLDLNDQDVFGGLGPLNGWDDMDLA